MHLKMHTEIKDKQTKPTNKTNKQTDKQSISQIHYAFNQARQHLVYLCVKKKKKRLHALIKSVVRAHYLHPGQSMAAQHARVGWGGVFCFMLGGRGAARLPGNHPFT